ncbi:MAG: LCP family protein, partial [Oscillospiraceae bacterium]|nr:LCP family protein [Oscillospiraceae bacterium]
AAVAVHQALVKAPKVSESPTVGLNDTASVVESSTVTRKENFYTFLVLGRDTGGGGNTDTILLAAYDVDNQALNVMSIPRDTMVNIPYDIKKINGVYNYAGGGDEGIQAVYTEVSQLVGFVPDFSVVVEWEAVGELVDAIGGVWFDVPYNMYYDDPTQDLHIYVDKGYQLLDGETAMSVIRWRQNNDGTGYTDGDIGRIA